MTDSGTDKFYRFVMSAAQDKTLENRLRALKPGDTAGFKALAKSQGYEFSDGELLAAAQAANGLTQGEQKELSEAELEVVSGGLVVIAIIAILISPLVPAIQKEPRK